MKRSSGVLLHISSLPSPYGIGTLGKAAHSFVDFLAGARQRYWQVLPITPTGYSNSPYQSCSSAAGNPYFIDLDILCDEGLLLPSELNLPWGEPNCVDYYKQYQNRYAVLKKAFERFDCSLMADFCTSNAYWLNDYALFEALKQHFGGQSFINWDSDIRLREPQAVEHYTRLLSNEITFYCFVQYQFDKQWTALLSYAHSKGISLIGDIPIYVPHDSVEVWVEPHLFALDDNLTPTLVAGVPPDYFSSDGQLWGNPVYNWDRHSENGFLWWRTRMGHMAKRFDVVRLDHFRGLESFWAVPYGDKTAVNGSWHKGPGMAWVNAIKKAHPNLRIIAEDLGVITPQVKNLLSASGYPGMRVMQFGFEPYQNSLNLPHNYPQNCVAYIGTHDNTTCMDWVLNADPQELGFAVQYLGLNTVEGFNFGFVRGLMTSAASLAIVQMQDYLAQDGSCRMNLPGTIGWWTYRCKPDCFTPALQQRIARYTLMSGRG